MAVAVIYGGTRANGNTEILTERVVQGIETERIYLRDHVIHPIQDQRHTATGFDAVVDDYDAVMRRILPHDLLLFVTPVYWYSMSGYMKNFIDRWSQTLRDTNFPDFKVKMAAKTAYVIAVGGDRATLKGLPLVQQFQYIFEFMGIRYGGYILGQGNKPGDVLEDEAALLLADALRKKLQRA
jgi:multimeric flavodoxin WrbA